MIGANAQWSEHLMNVRAALERRGQYIPSDNLLKTVYKCTSAALVYQQIEAFRKTYNIPRTEVYGNEGKDDRE